MFCNNHFFFIQPPFLSLFLFCILEKCTGKQLVYGMEIQVEQMEMYYYAIAAPIHWQWIRTTFQRTRYVYIWRIPLRFLFLVQISMRPIFCVEKPFEKKEYHPIRLRKIKQQMEHWNFNCSVLNECGRMGCRCPKRSILLFGKAKRNWIRNQVERNGETQESRGANGIEKKSDTNLLGMASFS